MLSKSSLEAQPDTLIGGRVANGLAENRYAEASQLIFDFCHLHFNCNSNKASFFSSNNLALPKSLFDRVGGFDSTFKLSAGEDRDFVIVASHLG